MAINNDKGTQNGSFTIVMAVVIVAVLGVAALSIDMGYGLVVKSELQNVADTGALAANRELALIYSNLATTCTAGSDDCYWGTHTLNSGERARIEAKVNEFSLQNKAGGIPIATLPSDMVYGKYDKTTGEIEPIADYKGVMGIKVSARRDATANGVVPTQLAQVLGTDSMSVGANSGATLSALKKAPAGKLGIPVAISKYWFTAHNSPCGSPSESAQPNPEHRIRLFPTGPQGKEETNFNAVGCAGWHTYTDYPASASKLKSILKDLAQNQFTSPETDAGVDSFNFTGGAVATEWEHMKHLYNVNKINGTWTTIVPVYDSPDCSNPNGAIKIVGFATAYIYDVKEAPQQMIDAIVSCKVVDFGEGGNPNDYGTLVGRPGMIQ